MVIPEAVSLEIFAGPDWDPAKHWLQHHDQAKLIHSDVPPHPEVVAWDLGLGETSVISMARARGNALCVLDDLAARTCADVLSVPVIGTLGIMLKARANGLIPLLKPEIERLIVCGSMLSERVVREALEIAGETS